ncbi:trehalose-phosphatase [Candidatus Uhrbacteria bacterium]|nr:trehalose-phosphatase [Candidatus Uhrbacteria bacterium]
MILLSNHFTEIKKRFTGRKVAIMLDFDGTLSSIASTPQRARIHVGIKKVLKKLSQSPHTMYIVSGRSVADVKKKIGIANVTYVGNHGMEWEMGGRRKTIPLPRTIKQAIGKAKQKLRIIQKKFPGILIEDKQLAVALHYRGIRKTDAKSFQTQTASLLGELTRDEHLKIGKGKKVFELLPNIAWNKGFFVRMMVKTELKNMAQKDIIYIGDDQTDEDVFRILPKALTIRVGKNKKSAARYYVRSLQSVYQILTMLVSRYPSERSIFRNSADQR